MMKIKISLLIIFMGIVCSKINAQKLYFSVEDNNLVKRNPLQVDFIKSTGLKDAIIFYQDDFVTHNKVQNFDKTLLKKSIELKIPNSNASGIALLDWEGSKAQIIYGITKVSTQRFNEVLNEFLSALRYAKQLRPNIKWSFYALPVRALKGYTYSEWKSRMDNINSIYREVDYICPNFYMFLRNDVNKYNEDVRQHVLLSIKIGQQFNKPVYGLIWNRYQTNSQLVPIPEFKKYMSRLLQISLNGKKLDGFIWWNAEGFYFKRKERYPMIRQEYSKVRNIDSYQNELLSSYYEVLKNLLK